MLLSYSLTVRSSCFSRSRFSSRSFPSFAPTLPRFSSLSFSLPPHLTSDCLTWPTSRSLSHWPPLSPLFQHRTDSRDNCIHRCPRALQNLSVGARDVSGSLRNYPLPSPQPSDSLDSFLINRCMCSLPSVFPIIRTKREHDAATSSSQTFWDPILYRPPIFFHPVKQHPSPLHHVFLLKLLVFRSASPSHKLTRSLCCSSIACAQT